MPSFYPRLASQKFIYMLKLKSFDSRKKVLLPTQRGRTHSLKENLGVRCRETEREIEKETERDVERER